MMQALLLSSMFSVLVFTMHFTEVSSSQGSELVSSADSVVRAVLSYGNVLIAASLVVCVILILIDCADLRGFCANLCPQQSSFRDFDEDGYFNDISIAVAPAVQFPMYPPVESTPESQYSGSAVYFEPLPDLASRRRNQEVTTNSLRLRPKVSHVGFDHMDSEDWDDGEGGQPYFDRSRELAKLERLVTNSQNQFPRTQLQYIKEMGSGWFGKVLEGEGQGILPGHKKTKVVVLMLKEDADQHEKLTFLQEGLPFKEIQDPNVVKLFSHCVETNPFLMILEYCPVDLKSFMQNNRSSVESFDRGHLILSFACDLARGLQAMHQHNYVHRDFALRNCLVTVERTVKVGDYGLSEELYKEDYYYDSNGDGIPIRWLAPEVLSFSENDVVLGRITRDSNIWSYGVTLWELVKFGTLPYTDLSNDNVLRLVVLERIVRLSKPDVPISNLDKLYQLMQRCWSEPTQRPSIRELIIMLLHLQTQTTRSDMLEFDQKWNQLMPRRNFDDYNGLLPSGQNYASSISNGTITTIAYSDGSDISILPEVVVRPTGFGSEFSELNPSLLAEAGSLQMSLRSASGTPDSATQNMLNPKSPVNEMSLAAELNITRTSFEEVEDDEGENEEENSDYLSGSNFSQTAYDRLDDGSGNASARFAEENAANQNAAIEHRAEVHKADGEHGRHALDVLGNINESFSFDFLSEIDDDVSRDTSRSKAEESKKWQPDESLQMESSEILHFSTDDERSLHRHNQKDSEQLFNELVTSTPKVSNSSEEKVLPTNSEFLFDSVMSFSGSTDQSTIGDLGKRSFMQPQKYTAYLQTVATSVEGDESEMDLDLENIAPSGQHQGHTAEFENFFVMVEPESETLAPAELADRLTVGDTSPETM